LDIKQWRGLWLPEHETHLIDWMQQKNEIVDGKPTYQHHKLTKALSFVRNFRTAIDVGGHCGLWSMHLEKRFQFLHAFEPVAVHRECFTRNVNMRDGVLLYPVALGDKAGTVSIHTSDTSSGDSWVNGEGEIPLVRLDDYDLPDVDFVKLDCEGFELFALRGGEAMLKRCRPIVCVEQKPGRAQKFGLQETEAVDYLKSLGANLLSVMSGDYILGW
jgi:FkbM family methyltransferase